MAVAAYWPIPIHNKCHCAQRLVAPGATAQPWVDFRDLLDKMPDAQKREAIGISNYRLLDAGKVQWGDIVTNARVRTFREVVSREKLTIPQMTAAGVKPGIARRAWETVHTPAEVLATEHRKQLVKQLEQAGVSAQQVKQQFARAMASRVVITGPSGTQKLARYGAGANFLPLVSLLGLDVKRVKAALQPKPEPAKPEPAKPVMVPEPATIEAFAREAQQFAQAVPVEARYGDTKVWIVDAFEEYQKTYPGATFDQFKAQLIQANQERKITLSEQDLPYKLSKADREKREASETLQGRAVNHLIRVPEKK